MDTILFTAYGRKTTGYDKRFPNIHLPPLDHVFIRSSSGQQWHLFGQKDKITPQNPQVGTAKISLPWFEHVHGNPNTAAGIILKVTGTCQNAANRLLALGGGDVSGAQGNELVILAYGKYGFKRHEFIEHVRKTAERLNGIIPQGTVDNVTRQISGDCDSDLNGLKQEFDERFHGHPLPNPTLNEFKRAYVDYHFRREQVFNELYSQKNNVKNADKFQKEYIKRVGLMLQEFLETCQDLLGDDLWTKELNLPPARAAVTMLNAPR